MTAGLKTVTLPIGDKEYQFGILGPKSLHDIVDYANDELLRSVRKSMEGEPVTEVAKMIREVGRPYTIVDLDEIVQKPETLLHIVYLAFKKCNPGVSKEEWLETLTQDDQVYLVSQLGKLNPIFDVKVEGAEDDPPANAEAV